MVKKRVFVYSIIGLLILLVGIFIINAAVDKNKAWHPASEFKIKIDGVDRTLQYAITNNLLTDSHTYASPFSIPNPGHGANEIWISIDSGEMTLQSALSGGKELKESSFTTYSSTSIPNPGHLATEIILSSGKSFQQAINDEDFVCIPDCTGKECGDDGCGGSCGTSGLHATCPSGTCVCDSGWDDCNNDNSCECDLSSNICEGTNCVAYTYIWKTGNWGTCSDTCAGTRTRSVWCEDNYGDTVADTYCLENIGAKPITSQNCICTWAYGSYLGCGFSLAKKCSDVIYTSCSSSDFGRTNRCKATWCAPLFKYHIWEYYCKQSYSPPA